MLFRDLDVVIGSHYPEMSINCRLIFGHSLRVCIFINHNRKKNHTIGPAFLQFLRLNMDKLKRFEIQSVCMLHWLPWKWPLWGRKGEIIGFPDIVFYFNVNWWGFVKDSSWLVGVFGQEIEMGGGYCLIYCITLPNSIFQLYYGLLSQKGYGCINFYIHFVLHS